MGSARMVRYAGGGLRQARRVGPPRRGLALPPLLVAGLAVLLLLALPPPLTPNVEAPPAVSGEAATRPEREPALPRVVLVPPDQGAPVHTAPPPPVGLSLATGGPPQALRAAPDPASRLLVQVPDNAALVDLGDLKPDGAWQRVGWEGWEGWIAAGVLRRRGQ